MSSLFRTVICITSIFLFSGLLLCGWSYTPFFFIKIFQLNLFAIFVRLFPHSHQYDSHEHHGLDQALITWIQLLYVTFLFNLCLLLTLWRTSALGNLRSFEKLQMFYKYLERKAWSAEKEHTKSKPPLLGFNIMSMLRLGNSWFNLS